jgi:drug/metabolite transporter (DMT)-like permease
MGVTVYPLFSALAWGLMFPVLAATLRHVDPANLTAIRYGGAAAVLVGILVAVEGRRALRPGGRLRELALLGTLGFAGFNLLTMYALGETAPQNAALLVATTPALTTLVAWVRDGRRPRPALLVLIAVALGGAALVITRGGTTGLAGFGPGDLLMLGAVLCWAVYTHGSGRFAGWSPLRFSTLTALAGTAAILAVTVLLDALGVERVPAPADLRSVAPELAYVVLVGAVAAVLSWNTGVRRMGAPNAALFMNLVPVTAFAVAIARGYHPVPGELVGAVVTVTALVAANVLHRRTASAAAPAAAAPTATAAPAAPPAPTAAPAAAPAPTAAPTAAPAPAVAGAARQAARGGSPRPVVEAA